jgi:hypothetical protein
MERILPDVYHFEGNPKKSESSHSYLLRRKEGNILVCHHGGPSSEDLKEIEKLGGIGSQWVCHQHDASSAGLHEELYARFGCMLFHHRRDQKMVTKRTDCPRVQFGDDGLEHGPDFEALYLPVCTDGFTIFRWHHAGKYFLFTSHAFEFEGGDWHIGVPYTAARKELWRPQVAKLAKWRFNYMFPGYTPAGDDGYYQVDEKAQKSFTKALRAVES